MSVNALSSSKLNIYDDNYLVLSAIFSSPSSLRLVNNVIDLVSREMDWSYKAGLPVQKATGALLHDLLRLLSSNSPAWLYRSFRRESFVGGFIGYRPFKRVYDGMRELGLIEVRPGYFQRDEDGGGAGEATRLRPTHALVSLAASYEITPQNYRLHFKAVDPTANAHLESIKVRATKNGDFWRPERGKLLPADYDNTRP